jgi:hypothetical protein
MPSIWLDFDIGGVVDLGMRPTAERTAHALRVALIGVVAPLLTPGAQQGAGMGFCSGNLTRRFTKVNELTNEGSHIGTTHGVVNINPCCA